MLPSFKTQTLFKQNKKIEIKMKKKKKNYPLQQ